MGFLTIVMVQEARITRQLSQHQLHVSKSRLAARSGLDKAATALSSYAWKNTPSAQLPFQQRLDSSGDDRNRDGDEDPLEDAHGDGFSVMASIEDDLTPSLALYESAASQRSRLLPIEGRALGISWVDQDVAPVTVSRIAVGTGGLDLNGGIDTGTGPEAAKFQAEYGQVYSASNLNHPFNERTRLLLNAWGNVYKYRAMVRPDKTYDYNLELDDPANMTVQDGGSPVSLRYSNPFGKFDRFDSSRDINMTTTELPLGDRLLAARPAGGYQSLKVPLEILNQYIDEWQDRTGLVQPGWSYADGTPIGPVPASLRKEMILDFIRSAELQPQRRDEILVFPGNDVPDPDPNDPVGSPFHFSSFETPEGRSYLNVRFITLRSAGINLHSVTPTVLAAAIHAVRGVVYGEYKPSNIDDSQDFLRQFQLRAPKENSHFISASNPVAGNPLFSITDSLRLASHLVSLRSSRPFANLKEVGDEIRGWTGSYDGRGQVFDARTRSSSWFPEYMDPYMGNARGYVLAYLLNPHVNSNHLVWDEAQVPSWNQGILSLGGGGSVYGYRDFSVKNFFDKFMPHKTGGALAISGSSRSVTAMGYCLEGSGRVLAKSRIETNIETAVILDVHVQKDWVKAATIPGTAVSTLGDLWVTYPEVSRVPPAHWDGQLALKPQLIECPFGEDPRMRVILSGYEDNSTAPMPNDKFWFVGPRSLVGPSEDPARGLLLNSLQPSPYVVPKSLVCSDYSTIEEACDLLPGGGIRVSPYNNTLSLLKEGSGGSYPNRREALLVLGNTLLDDALYTPSTDIDLTGQEKVLPSFHEGAVSFYFKPRFSFTKETNSRVRGNRTLFSLPFVINDQETLERCEAIGYSDGLYRYHYTALLRLCWGPCESSGGGRFDEQPLTWPWVVEYQYSAFPGQSLTGMHLFQSMMGIVDPFGVSGYLMMPNMPDNLVNLFDNSAAWGGSGDGKPWHWASPNPYAEERLQLEFVIAKFADVPFNSGIDNSTIENLNATFHDVWDDMDLVSQTADTDAYVSPQPLNLFDTSSISIPGYHTLRKTFILSHPYKIAGSTKGQGPKDSAGNHQPLLAPGRWNHILVVWRDLYDLLNNGATHKGGCLATYINGTFRKTSPMGFTMGGLYVQQDLCELYPSDENLGPLSPWQPSDQHDPYQYITFGGFGSRPRFFPLYQESRYDGEFYKHKYYTFPRLTGISAENPYDYNHVVPPLNSYPQDGSFLHSYDYGRFSRAPYSCRNEDLFLKFSSRFYFGFVPYTQREYADPSTLKETPYTASSICWGSFMDIQIFAKAASVLINDDEGFVSDLPNFDNFSPYPNSSGASPLNLYPFNLVLHHEFSRGLRLASVSWNAHLPEYHEFWDDQNNAVAGPDSFDAQDLKCGIEVLGVTQGALRCNQIASTPGLLSQWLASRPQRVDSADDLKLAVDFKGPQVTMSTPIIESVEVLLLHTQPRYHVFSIE